MAEDQVGLLPDIPRQFSFSVLDHLVGLESADGALGQDEGALGLLGLGVARLAGTAPDVDHSPGGSTMSQLSLRSSLGRRPRVMDRMNMADRRRFAFGKDAYPDLNAKAAALLHSLARNHALIDGNKRLALAGTIAFYGLNGRRLTLTNDEAYELVMSVAEGRLDTVDAIAAALTTQPRR